MDNKRITNTTKVNYTGKLAAVINDFVLEKQSIGYSYLSEKNVMLQFSHFTENFKYPDNTLTAEVVKMWISARPNEADKTRYTRFSLIKMFAEYMVRMGYTAYIPFSTEAGKLHKTFVPYIFTHEEIKRFFRAADTTLFSDNKSASRRHLIMPLMFRLMYCCGLRLSETTRLLGEDVDLQKGILTIRDSKFGKSRYVPMSEETIKLCVQYAQNRYIGKDTDWFFASRSGSQYINRSVYSTFRDILRLAGISHGGRGAGPRVHDLRHTFATHCLQKWTENGVDITTALPYLKEYMGHNHISATEQYLRMTAEVYPEISDLAQKTYGYIIPNKEVYPQ